MSLLHYDTQEEIDAAARGEELTKNTSHLVWASIAAVVVVSAAIATYFIAGEKPPVATGEIVQVWAHPRHVQTSGLDANGAPKDSDRFDQVLVIAHIKLHNQSSHPIALHNILTDVTLGDGVHSSYAATRGDYESIFIVYPELAELHGKILPTELTLDPGQTEEGNIVSAFRMTKEEWDARKDLSFTLGLRYQPSLVLAPHTAVIEK
jgi:hypothetical protein